MRNIGDSSRHGLRSPPKAAWTLRVIIGKPLTPTEHLRHSL
jgi:hypothetical protein